LKIGLIPEQNVFKQMERYELLAEYLSESVGARVTLKILPRYGNIVENFRSANLDGAFFGSFTYALAHKRLGVRVVARPVGLDGTSTYHGLILVRKDSAIRTIEDMKGKRFVFVDRATTAGYLLPLDFFYEHGIENHLDYLGETYFSGTHEDAILDVLNSRADIGAAKNTVFERIARENERVASELLVLARSPNVPENGLALRPEMDVGLQERLKQALLAVHSDPAGQSALQSLGAVSFVETTDEDYDPVYRYAEQIGLDLSTYDYNND